MSTTPVSCPAREELERVALGGAATPELEDHLAGCEACRQTLARIREDNRFLRDFAVDGSLPRARRGETGVFTGEIPVPGYEIVHEIHRGGQGVVYLARQRSTKRDVAIKVMKQGPFATIADRARFDREIDSLSRLDHPNIVAVHDAGAIEGASYFVMNYIDGKPLDEAVAGLPRDAMLDVFARVCEAVHAAHLRGVMHRDLKPSNILVDRAGQPHVLDFGLAKSVEGVGELSLTGAGQFVGSLPWASPEQVEGSSDRIDLRTDVYSLGAILYQLLTGAPPFDVGSNLRDAVENITQHMPPPPSTVRAGVGHAARDDELDTITIKCLSKARSRRYQSAGELGSDIRNYLAGDPIAAKRDSALYVLRKTLRRYRLRVAATGAFFVLLVLFAVVMTLLYNRSARLEQSAVRYAGELSTLLSESNIEQGRLAGMLGDLGQSEQLLWRELFGANGTDASHAHALHSPPGPPRAYWALWELYRRIPCRRTLIPQPEMTRLATMANDGQSLWTAESDGRIRRLDALGAELECFQLPPMQTPSLRVVHRTGALVLDLRGAVSRLLERDTPAPLLEFPTPLTPDTGGCFLSRSGRRCAYIADGAAVVWSTHPPAQLARFSVDSEPLNALAVSADDRRLAARDRLGGLHIWDLDTQRRIIEVPPPAATRTTPHERGGLLFSPDGMQLADAWMESPGRIWDLTSDPMQSIELSERCGDYRVTAFRPDGRLLAIGDYGGNLRIFDAASGRRVAGFAAHAERVLSVAFTSDGMGLWTAGAGEFRLWDVVADQGVRTLRVQDDLFHAIDVSPDGRWFVASGGLGVLHRVELPELAAASVGFHNTGTLACVAISADGRRVAAGTYDNAAFCWSADALDRAPLRLAHPNRVSSVRFNPTGDRIVTACDDGAVRIWRADDGALERELPITSQRIPQIDFDPSRQRVAAVTRDGALVLLDLNTGARENWIEPSGNPLRAVRFTSDGNWLILGGAERALEIWDVQARRRAATLEGHSQEVYCLDVSPDGDLIASGDSGGRIHLWHRPSACMLATLDGHGGAVMSLRFTPDGQRLLSASLDGTIRVWDLGYYRQHIAGQVEARLRRLGLLDAPGAGAWLAWARAVTQATEHVE